MLGNSFTLSNGLKISCDFLSFTLSQNVLTDDILSSFGLNRDDFVKLPKGAYGYKSVLQYHGYNIRILFDGSENMGIHFDISGSALEHFLSLFKETLSTDTSFGKGYELDFDDTVLICLLKLINSLGKITRFDLCCDDLGCNYFSVSDIVQYEKDQRIRTKFKYYEYDESKYCKNPCGNTVYFGSPKSDIRLRIYDKQLERNRQLDENNKISTPWVRWEFQFRGSRAASVCNLITSGYSLGFVFSGVLKNYFSLINPDDSNISRCSLVSLYSDFLNGIEKLLLSLPVPEPSLSKRERWFNKQCLPTFLGLYIANGGNFDFLIPKISYSLNKLENDPVFKAFVEPDILEAVSYDFESLS